MNIYKNRLTLKTIIPRKNAKPETNSISSMTKYWSDKFTVSFRNEKNDPLSE